MSTESSAGRIEQAKPVSVLDRQYRENITLAMGRPKKRTPSAEKLDDIVRAFMAAKLGIKFSKNSWWDIGQHPEYPSALAKLPEILRGYIAQQVVYAQQLEQQRAQ